MRDIRCAFRHAWVGKGGKHYYVTLEGNAYREYVECSRCHARTTRTVFREFSDQWIDNGVLPADAKGKE